MTRILVIDFKLIIPNITKQSQTHITCNAQMQTHMRCECMSTCMRCNCDMRQTACDMKHAIDHERACASFCTAIGDHGVSFWHPLRKKSKQATCWAGWHLGCIATTLGAPPNCPMGLVAIREACSEHQLKMQSKNVQKCLFPGTASFSMHV